MPAVPKVGGAGGKIWYVKVFRDFKSEQQCRSTADVGVSAKVKKYLKCESQGGKLGFGGGVGGIGGKAVARDEAEIVSKCDFFKKSLQE